MLPLSNDKKFPSALKARRIELNLNRLSLSRLAGLNQKMVRRYEETSFVEFAIPRLKSWLALNIALGYKPSFIYKETIKELPESVLMLLDNKIIVPSIFKPVIIENKVEEIVEVSIPLQVIKTKGIQTFWQHVNPHVGKIPTLRK